MSFKQVSPHHVQPHTYVNLSGREVYIGDSQNILHRVLPYLPKGHPQRHPDHIYELVGAEYAKHTTSRGGPLQPFPNVEVERLKSESKLPNGIVQKAFLTAPAPDVAAPAASGDAQLPNVHRPPPPVFPAPSGATVEPVDAHDDPAAEVDDAAGGEVRQVDLAGMTDDEILPDESELAEAGITINPEKASKFKIGKAKK